MTLADSAHALRRSLDQPTLELDHAAKKATAIDPLPPGWVSLCSAPYRALRSRWYATAPYYVLALDPKLSTGLAQTVTASTWPELHRAVAAQLRIHRRHFGS